MNFTPPPNDKRCMCLGCFGVISVGLGGKAYHAMAEVTPPILWPVTLFPMAAVLVIGHCLYLGFVPLRFRK